MRILTFLFSTIIELYTMILLLRIWMQWTGCNFYNPFSQFIIKTTQPIIKPLRNIIPTIGLFDSASLVVAFILCIIKAIILFMVVTFQSIILILAILILLKSIGLLVFWILLITTIVNWFHKYSQMEYTLTQLTEPLLRCIRSLIPTIMDGIDFSPIVLTLLLYIINRGIGELLQYTGNILLPGFWMIL